MCDVATIVQVVGLLARFPDLAASLRLRTVPLPAVLALYAPLRSSASSEQPFDEGEYLQDLR